MHNNLIKIDKVPQDDIDKMILRKVMIAEAETINDYIGMCYNTSNKDIKDLLHHLIEEEQEHFEKAEELLEEMEGHIEEDDDDESGY